jgi:hypothetical protein
MTRRELERLLDLLGKLSEEPLSGSLLDAIGELRSEIYDLLDAKDAGR